MCLVTSQFNFIVPGKIGQAAGWGVTDDDPSPSRALLTVSTDKNGVLFVHQTLIFYLEIALLRGGSGSMGL